MAVTDETSLILGTTRSGRIRPSAGLQIISARSRGGRMRELTEPPRAGSRLPLLVGFRRCRLDRRLGRG